MKFAPDQYQQRVRAEFEEHRFDELNALLRSLSDRYARSECSDRPFSLVFSALIDGAPRMQGRYDEWVKHDPGSAFALTARGEHFLVRAAYARGDAWASQTSSARFDGMHRFLGAAMADFNAALESDPTFSVPMAGVLTALTLDGDVEDRRRIYSQFVIHAPHSYVLDAAMLNALVPRWGGTFAELDEFAQQRKSRVGSYTDMSLLPSLAECLAAEDYATRGDPDAAQSALTAGKADSETMDSYCLFVDGILARRLGDYDRAIESLAMYRAAVGPMFYLSKEADSWLHVGQHRAALQLFNLGIRYRSASPSLYCGRAAAELGLGEIGRARKDVAVGLATDPADAYCLKVEQAVAKRSNH